MIADNLAEIQRRINQAAARAGRSPHEVRVVAAAKGQGLDKIQAALSAGIEIFGHNYVQEAARQLAAAQCSSAELHMIGHLQKNKVGKAVELFHVVETVDSASLALTLDKKAQNLGKIIRVMIQVNMSGESQKSGISEEEAEALARTIRGLSSLRLEGLMTMPPLFDDPEGARPYFVRLRQLRDRLIESGALASNMRELSMGMTGDFEVAVEEGATLVRIGTALFGPRE